MSFFTQKLEDSLNEPGRISFMGPKYVVDLYRSSQRPVRLREGFPLKEYDGTAGGFRTIHDEFSAELQPRNATETESKKLLLHVLRYLEENPRPCVAFEDIYIIENGTCLALIKNPQPIKVISLPLPESDPEEPLIVEDDAEEEKEKEVVVVDDVSAPALSDPHPVVIEDAPVVEEEVNEEVPADAPSSVVIEDVPADDQQVDHEKVDAPASVDPKEEVVEDQAEKQENEEEKEQEEQEAVAVVEEEKALEETEEVAEEEEKPVTKLKSIVVHVRKERKISISTASLMGTAFVLYVLFYNFAPHDLKT